MSKAAARMRTQFVCSACGSAQMKWMGKCPDCGEWNTLDEVQVAAPDRTRSAMPLVAGAGARPQSLATIALEGQPRLPLSVGELSRVLGGGIVPGSCVLVGGDPGIGKSTLLLQMAHEISAGVGPTLYVSAEESAHQVGRRAARLGVGGERLHVFPEVLLEPIVEQIEAMQPHLVIVDSIQAIYSTDNSSAAGSVSQVRDCAAALLRLAKRTNIPIFLVGHVTKEGAIAGPRVLEHMVDVVLQLEGERFHSYRLLRSVKNRFGSTNEVGVFEMGEAGMVEVKNPSELFLAERLPNAAGSAIAVAMEGSRPLLVEVQALCSATAFSQPRRTVSGFDMNRLLLLSAVLSRRLGLDLSDQDIFVNVIGGLSIGEPAADLPMAVAVASSYRNRPVAVDLALMGEVGLSGELRSVGHLPRRLQEAAKLGFKRALVPRGSLPRNGAPLSSAIEVLGARTLSEALDLALLADNRGQANP